MEVVPGPEETQPTPPELSPEEERTAAYLRQRAQESGRDPGFGIMGLQGAPPAETAEAETAEQPGEAQEPTEAEGAEEAAAETTAEAEAPAEDVGQAEEAQPDGDGEPGPKPGDARGELPVGVKKRLDKVRRRTERLAAENQARDARIAELEAKLAQPGGGQEQRQEQQQDTTPPAGGTEDPGPYPTRQDYESDDAWIEAVEQYEDKLEKQSQAPPKDTPPADKAPPEGQQDQQLPPWMTQQQRQQEQRQRQARQQFEDLFEAIDEWEEAPDNLRDDFREMVDGGRIHVSHGMLEHLAYEDDGAQIAAALVKSPRQSRRIAQLPKSQQVQAMRRLLNGNGTKPAPEETKPSPAPVIKPLRGKGEAPQKSLNEEMPTEDYLRERAKRGSSSTIGFPV